LPYKEQGKCQSSVESRTTVILRRLATVCVINCTHIMSTVINNMTNVNDVVGITSAPIYQLLFTTKIYFYFTFFQKQRRLLGENRDVRRIPVISCLPDLTPGTPTQLIHYFSATSCGLQRYHALWTKRRLGA